MHINSVVQKFTFMFTVPLYWRDWISVTLKFQKGHHHDNLRIEEVLDVLPLPIRRITTLPYGRNRKQEPSATVFVARGSRSKGPTLLCKSEVEQRRATPATPVWTVALPQLQMPRRRPVAAAVLGLGNHNTRVRIGGQDLFLDGKCVLGAY